MRKSVILPVIALGILTASVRAEDPVYFADAALKALVEQRLGVSNPTPSDMLRLTFLAKWNSGVSDLTGLQYAINMTDLRLDQSLVSDLSPLAGLTNLATLILDDNRITDVSPLSGLTRLRKLTLFDNAVTDIHPLSGLVNLTDLVVMQNQISDLSPLAGLTTNLVDLSLDTNPISDISALSGLTRLVNLGLSWCEITDISALSHLTNLKSLSLYQNHINDISVVARFPLLTSLYLSSNEISDISALSGLTRLGYLDLMDNSISDISPLAGLTKLYSLSLVRNPLNNEAYCTYLPLILANNPSLVVWDNTDYSFNENPPSSVSASDGSYSDKVRITWDSVCSVMYDTRYMVYRSDSPTGTKTPLCDWQLETTFDDTTAVADVTYYYWVKARLQEYAWGYGWTDYSSYDAGHRSTVVVPCTLTASSTEGGSVTVPGKGIFSYPPGSEVSVKAVAEPYYLFTGWTGTAVDAGRVANPTSPSTTVTVNADYTLVANFRRVVLVDPRTVTISSADGGFVSVPGEGAFQYEKGMTVSVTAKAQSGYLFWGWTGTVVEAGKVADPASSTTTLKVDDNYTLSANFVLAKEVSVLVLTPNGGEILVGGGAVPIKWQVGGPIEFVAIELSVDGGSTWTPLAQCDSQADAWDWTVPLANSDRCLIRVRAVENRMIGDTSNAPFSIHGVAWCVDAAATGKNDGTSWANAFVYLQDALTKASGGDAIWVAEGLYWPDLGAGCKLGSRAATFQLKNGVAIYGGFPTGGGTWQQRDPARYKSILSGDIGAIGVATDNSFHVVTGSYTEATAVLDGFVITGGNASGQDPDDKGGGMYNWRSNSAVRNCTFVGNAAALEGGGAYSVDSTPLFINCVFSGNMSNDRGGAMAIFGGTVTAINCTFAANDGRWRAGGVFVAGSLAFATTNSIFWGNSRTFGTIYDQMAQITSNPAPVVNYCCIQGGVSLFSGEGNIASDPLFVDADGADDIAGTADDDLRLQSGSPCIDAGNSAAVPPDIATDLAGQPRITGPAVDMGAHESGGTGEQ
jgi:hypothetical protein